MHTQKQIDALKHFKPGQSGNPLGRPKGSKNITSIIKHYLKQEYLCKDPITEKKVQLSAEEIIALNMIINAMRGDNSEIDKILDRIEGKVKQKIELSGEMAIREHLNSCIKKSKAAK